uniref:Uncharacterized protein n=1 Tax=Cacopsylla melanoneura TaxID=428564 RepID=A0A8D9FDL0_9HEMI
MSLHFLYNTSNDFSILSNLVQNRSFVPAIRQICELEGNFSGLILFTMKSSLPPGFVTQVTLQFGLLMLFLTTFPISLVWLSPIMNKFTGLLSTLGGGFCS